MAIQELRARDDGFMAVPANGDRSFEEVVVTGPVAAGEMLKLVAGEYVAIVAGDTPEAIARFYQADTVTSSATILKRDATVKAGDLTYPAGATPVQIDAINSALVDLGIILR